MKDVNFSPLKTDLL